MAVLEGIKVLESLYFSLKRLPFFNAACFAAFLCYEQNSIVAIAHSLSFAIPLKSF